MNKIQSRKFMARGGLALAATFSLLIGLFAAESWDTDEGVGSDLAAEAACLTCHSAIGMAWQNLSSHKVLHDCLVCHEKLTASGPGHATRKACSHCHSEKSHPNDDTACSTCHDPHGSHNAFLVRESISLPTGGSAAVHFTLPKGADKDGLAHAGAEAATPGTGVCEVCHASTAYYNKTGTGAAHNAQWCIECHSHQEGFGAAEAKKK